MHGFSWVQFRDTIVGRQVYLEGTRLQVYWVVMLARDYEGDLQKAADHIGVPVVQIESVLRCAEAYRDEIEAEIADFERIDEEELRRLIPDLQVFTVKDLEDADAPSL